MDIPDQVTIWDKRHLEGYHDRLRGLKSRFAKLASGYFSPSSDILELGCGVGRDAIYFAAQGHQVIATDAAASVIAHNSEMTDRGVIFMSMDMTKAFPFKDERFNAVYSHLSLHYFTNTQTRSIVQEIHRITNDKGIFAFSCKNLSDPNFGKGREIEENLFVRESGVALHLFSRQYVSALLEGLFEILYLEESEQEYNDEHSSLIHAIAKKL
jgi:tellurite methyltransferase